MKKILTYEDWYFSVYINRPQEERILGESDEDEYGKYCYNQAVRDSLVAAAEKAEITCAREGHHTSYPDTYKNAILSLEKLLKFD